MAPRGLTIAGNWKMHGSRAELAAWMAQVAAWPPPAGLRLVLFPPAVLIAQAAQGPLAAVGAQDLSAHARGAYTGELSGAMLAEAGAREVLIGHSERRRYHGEDDALLARKFQAALDAGLAPMLCVGETREQRERGQTEAVLERQLGTVLRSVGAAGLARASIAYEPVWAIGTGLTATPEMAQQAHRFLRSLIARESATLADSLPILYGGSMKPDNAAALLSEPDIDGGLIGGASLKAEDFLAIARAAARVLADR